MSRCMWRLWVPNSHQALTHSHIHAFLVCALTLSFSSPQTAAVWRLKADLERESVSEGEINPIAQTRALCFNICSLSLSRTPSFLLREAISCSFLWPLTSLVNHLLVCVCVCVGVFSCVWVCILWIFQDSMQQMYGFLWQPEDHTVRHSLPDGSNKTSAQYYVSFYTLVNTFKGALYASNVRHEGPIKPLNSIFAFV